MTETYRITRRLTVEDCRWFDPNEVFEVGDIVFGYHGPTYGCISPSGTAVSRIKGITPFIEIPHDALELIES